jgi:CBS domain-containing protein
MERDHESVETNDDLAIRTLHVFTAEGAEGSRETVYCKRRARSAAVAECAACAACAEVVDDPLGRSSHVVCRHRPPEAAPTEPAGAGALSAAYPAVRAPIAAILGRHVAAVRASVPRAALARFFTERGIADAPVVTAEGRLLGVVSRDDVARGANGATAGELMTRLPFTLRESAPIVQAAAVMAYESAARVPVVDDDDVVVGVLSASDLLRWIARQDGYLRPLAPEEMEVDEHP